ncbi:MAG: D-alanine--D-alanine ligase [Deltaproteobacteria bacterium]|nr:D-alanine--D-alanine ligase [Deltaproteobacteria bacterium]
MSNKIVGVVFGGRSVEHEISLLSAKSIIKNIDSSKFDILPIFIGKNGSWRKASVEDRTGGREIVISDSTFLAPSLDPQKPVFYEIENNKIRQEHKLDVLFPILHGTYGEDGTVQGMFELMGIPFVGSSVLGSSIGMDKIAMKTIFRVSGIPVVEFIGFKNSDWTNEKEIVKKRILGEIGIPCFVKSANLGSSVGITKVKSENELEKAVDFACEFSNKIIVEKAVLNPREIEVSVLGNEEPIASLPGEIIPHREFYDYKAKYTEKGTELIAPVKLNHEKTENIQKYAIRAFKVIDCYGMARVDFLMEKSTGDIFVSELNTIPGFTQISMYPKLWEVSGISYKDLISRLIDLAFERHENVKELRTDFKDRS